MTDRALAVLHLDGGRRWAGGQNQARLLMRGLREQGVPQLMLCPKGSPTEERLAGEGLPVRGIPWRGPLDPRAMWSVGFATVPESESPSSPGGPPTVIHCHDAHALQIAIPGAKLRGIPLVASRRVHYATSPMKWNRADRVLAISETVERSLVDKGVDPGRIRRVPSGVDPDELEALPGLEPALRERLGLTEGDFLVGNVGHLFPYKGQSVIPEAASRVPGSHWVIVGEGPERGSLEQAVVEHGVGDRVHLPGRIPDARRALRELDVFAFPSVDEALGTSLLDAMFVGVPVVAARAKGPAEVMGPVHESVGAGLVPPEDPEALARAVERLRSDPELRERLVRAQTERAGDFTARRTADATLAVYRELAGGPGAGSGDRPSGGAPGGVPAGDAGTP